jgi:transposase
MFLSEKDLRQIDETYLSTLTAEALLRVSVRLLGDLKEARDRLNQTPANSSRPPSSHSPWEGAAVYEEAGAEDEAVALAEETHDIAGEADEAATPEAQPAKQPQKRSRKAGRQKGAKGHGRKVTLAVTGEQEHRAGSCAACGQALAADAVFEATTGLYVVDLETAGGLRVTHIKHLYGGVRCACGHVTHTQPGRCAPEEEWQVELTEWHLVGPTLMSLIICLAQRLRVSRPKIKEFLQDWLAIDLSVGCINQCLHEGGRAVAPVEAELLAAVKHSGLLQVDETPWKEKGQLKWLWVLATHSVVLFLIGSRKAEVIADYLAEFGGWLMSDGYQAYRAYGKRLRCWAHLLRKARGLAESSHQAAHHFGAKIVEWLLLFMEAVYRAREGPATNLKEELAEELVAFQRWCEQHRDSEHEKTRQLAREFLNDWEAIWSVLAQPDLPLTNNLAEQCLRHWVIARRISFGTRSPQGSRAFAVLASVIETCRLHKVSPWPYLAQVIAARRKGEPAPPLPFSLAC